MQLKTNKVLDTTFLAKVNLNFSFQLESADFKVEMTMSQWVFHSKWAKIK